MNKRVIYVSIVIYIISLLTPSYMQQNDIFPGFLCLLIGPLGIFFFCFVWLANPLLLISWMATRKENYIIGLIASSLSLIIAITFFLCEKLPQGSSGIFPVTIQYGYYIWLLSICIMIVANLILKIGMNSKNAN